MMIFLCEFQILTTGKASNFLSCTLKNSTCRETIKRTGVINIMQIICTLFQAIMHSVSKAESHLWTTLRQYSNNFICFLLYKLNPTSPSLYDSVRPKAKIMFRSAVSKIKNFILCSGYIGYKYTDIRVHLMVKVSTNLHNMHRARNGRLELTKKVDPYICDIYLSLRFQGFDKSALTN